MNTLRTTLVSLLSLLLFTLSYAETPPLPPAEEARAQALMRELRCVACENEPISQSAAPIAEDMRERVRVLVSEGKTDTEVRGWFEDRYGEFVLLRPKSSGLTGTLLWSLPFILLGFGAFFGWHISRRKSRDSVEITPEDA